MEQKRVWLLLLWMRHPLNFRAKHARQHSPYSLNWRQSALHYYGRHLIYNFFEFWRKKKVYFVLSFCWNVLYWYQWGIQYVKSLFFSFWQINSNKLIKTSKQNWGFCPSSDSRHCRYRKLPWIENVKDGVRTVAHRTVAHPQMKCHEADSSPPALIVRDVWVIEYTGRWFAHMHKYFSKSTHAFCQ